MEMENQNMGRTRLTSRRLEAIQEALCHRLAGEIESDPDDPSAPRREDYEEAADWIAGRITALKSGRRKDLRA